MLAKTLGKDHPEEQTTAETIRLMVFSHSYIFSLARDKWLALRDTDSKIEILVVTPKFWREREVNWIQNRSEPYSGERIRFVPVTTVGEGFVSRHVYSWASVARLMRSFNPHIVQVEAEPWSAVYAEIALLRKFVAPRAKLVFFTWWNTPRKLPLPFRISHHLCLAATDAVVAGNHGALEILASHGYRGPVVVVPQWGVDETMFHPGDADKALLERFSLTGRFVVGFVGRLTARKGVDTLLKAAVSLTATGLESQLLVVGDGPELASLKSTAKELGISERVSFAGSAGSDEIPGFLRCMNTLVLPSTKAQWEQFGHVLIEAMACGVPVVGSESGEIPYVTGDAGLVFPIGDSGALADCLYRIAREEGLACALRQRGQQRVQALYTHAAIARRLSAAYRAIHGDGRGGELELAPPARAGVHRL